MLRVLIVDDEQLILDNISFILRQMDDVEIAGAFSDPVEALVQYESLAPDVTIMDINMPPMNGLEFAEKIREKDPKARIIFLTAYENYAIDAFAVHAMDYILKPVTTSKLKSSFDRILDEEGRNKEKLRIREGVSRPMKIPGLRENRIHLLDISEVLYIEVNQRIVTCRTAQHVYQLRHSISYWEENLSKVGWFRCHRSFLVNMDKVSDIAPMFNNTYDIHLHGCDVVIPVGRTYVADFKRYFHL